MSKLWIMVGAPGSGKSTYIAQHNIPNIVAISRDKIRLSMIKDDEPYFSRENEVYKKFIEEIAEALDNTRVDHVFVDQTSLNEGARAKLLNALSRCRAHYDELNAIVFNLPLKRILKQNAQRTGRALVPRDDVISMYNRMTIPTKEEGFDNVYIYDGKHWRHG